MSELLNRRTALALVASLSAAATPLALAASAAALEAAAAEIERCWQHLGQACDVIEVPKEKYGAWKKAQPATRSG
jgi:hypothetical protein